MSRPLASVCYHESGHLVLMLALGFPVESATIVPAPPAGGRQTLGQVAPGKPAPPAGPVQPLTDSEAAMVLLAAAMVDVSGGIADQLAGFAASGLESDEASVDSICDVVWSRLGVETCHYRHLIRAEATRYLREHWPAVQRVASVLLAERTITGERARQAAGELPAPDLRALAGALNFWTHREARRRAAVGTAGRRSAQRTA